MGNNRGRNNKKKDKILPRASSVVEGGFLVVHSDQGVRDGGDHGVTDPAGGRRHVHASKAWEKRYQELLYVIHKK